jgi:hypothetical protein
MVAETTARDRRRQLLAERHVDEAAGDLRRSEQRGDHDAAGAQPEQTQHGYDVEQDGRRYEAGEREADHDQDENDVTPCLGERLDRRRLAGPCRGDAGEPREPQMQRQADQQVEAREQEVDLVPVHALQQPAGQRPEDRRGKPRDQRQIGDAPLRLAARRLRQQGEGRRIKHEGRSQFDQNHAGEKGVGIASQAADRQGDGGADRPHGQDARGAMLVGEAAGIGRNRAACQKGERHEAIDPFHGQLELGGNTGARMLKLW